jgi:hypothetical protein
MSHLKKECKQGKRFTEIRLTKSFELNEIIDLIRSKVTLLDYGWYYKIEKYRLGDYSLLIEWRN